MRPSGMRFGTPALTSRGMDETDMEVVADLIDQGVNLAAKIQNSLDNRNNFKEFKECIAGPKFESEINQIAQQVYDFASGFPIPGKEYE